MSVVAEPGFMPSAVPCLQREAEFTQLLELYRERKPMSVLEIGTYFGGTLYHWIKNAPQGARVVSLDSYATDVDNRDLYPEWCKGHTEFSLKVIAGDSRVPAIVEQAQRWAPYDWVFIDAGHFYEEVKADWLNYGSLSTGVVAFHDINYGPVAQLWAEIKAEYSTREIIFDPTEEWHGIGVVFV